MNNSFTTTKAQEIHFYKVEKSLVAETKVVAFIEKTTRKT